MGNYFTTTPTPAPVMPAKGLERAIPKNLIKVITSGDCGVGKTSIYHQFVHETEYDRYNATIGAHFLTKTMNIGGQEYKLNLWDVSGPERFRVMNTMYYIGASIALVVFDLNDDKTFGLVEDNVVQFVNCTAGENARTPHNNLKRICVLVGNKTDLPRVVSRAAVQKMLNKYPFLKYYETTAKETSNIRTMFEEVMEELILGEERNKRVMLFRTKLTSETKLRDIRIETSL